MWCLLFVVLIVEPQLSHGKKSEKETAQQKAIRLAKKQVDQDKLDASYKRMQKETAAEKARNKKEGKRVVAKDREFEAKKDSVKKKAAEKASASEKSREDLRANKHDKLAKIREETERKKALKQGHESKKKMAHGGEF